MAMINVKLCSIIVLSFCYCNAATMDILSARDNEAALASVRAAEPFNYESFFAKVGLAGKSAEHVKKAFEIVDREIGGFIEEDALQLFLRALTEAETKDFLQAGDSDGDGKIGPAEFQAMMKKIKTDTLQNS